MEPKQYTIKDAFTSIFNSLVLTNLTRNFDYYPLVSIRSPYFAI